MILWLGWRGLGRTVKKGDKKIIMTQGGGANGAGGVKQKTPEQIAQQKERIFAKLDRQYNKNRDQGDLIMEQKDQIRQQIQDGKQQVSTKRKRKKSEDYTDLIQGLKVERKERIARVTGQQNDYVTRQKLSNKQIDQLHEKINALDQKLYDNIQRTDQIKRRRSRVYQFGL